MEQNVTRELRKPINYNYFFHPNFCHVCKSEDQSKVKPCPQCRMISYCSEEHKLLHREQHEEICHSIVNVSKQRDIWDTRNMTLEKWVLFKKKNLQLLQDILCRKLEPYEQQMFLFAKSCLTCREQNNLAVTCVSCYSVNKCVDHIFTHNEHKCMELQQCLFYNIESSIISEQEKIIPKELLNININIVYDMQSFIHDGLHINCDRYSCVWSCEDYIHSDKLSGPLTLFHGMRDANLLDLMSLHDFFIVHIIAGSFLDFHSLSAWEVILHKLNPGATLLVAMIEPYLPEKYKIIQICQDCTDQGKKIQYDYHPMLYYSYVCMLHTQPNIIIMFNAEFGNDIISIQTIKALQHEACPILLTTKSESKAHEAVIKIQEVLGLALTPIINKQNKFASRRTYRDYENDSVYFPNQHLVIYRDLLTPNEPTQTSSNDNEHVHHYSNSAHKRYER